MTKPRYDMPKAPAPAIPPNSYDPAQPYGPAVPPHTGYTSDGLCGYMKDGFCHCYPHDCSVESNANIWFTYGYRGTYPESTPGVRSNPMRMVPLAIGSAANELRDVIVEIVNRRLSRTGYASECNEAVSEISAVFEQWPPERKAPDDPCEKRDEIATLLRIALEKLGSYT